MSNIKHNYVIDIKDNSQPTFILLHGTGGNEYDLLPIASYLNENYNYLSIRGNVNENGMNRYFKRLDHGIYDEEDLHKRGEELFAFIKGCSKTYKFDINNIIFVGFSNGANIAINILLKNYLKKQTAILLHPLYPITYNKVQLQETNVFCSFGINDPIIPVLESENVYELLNDVNASVEVCWTQQGHQITNKELDEAKVWLHNKVSPLNN